MIRRINAALALFAALSGCNPSGSDDEPVAVIHTIPASSPSEAAAKPVPFEAPRFILDAEGFTVRTADARARFAFGSRQAAVMRAAAVASGSDGTLSLNDECGAGPMQFAAFRGLSLGFQDGKFVGWVAAEGSNVVTVDGVRLGTLLADLSPERGVVPVADTTLDGEVEYSVADGSTLGGFVSEGAEPRLTSLYAGMTCFFR